MIATTPITGWSRDLSDAAWLDVLRDDLALLEAETRKELQTQHPGARWRVLDLLTRAADRRRQIGLLKIRAEAFSE